MVTETPTRVAATDLEAGMTVRYPATLFAAAGPWLTVEKVRHYLSRGVPVVYVKFTNLLVHHPYPDREYEVQP